ncbi:flavin reductase [Agromyces sp. Marseille-P2726]|uniref:flavin reductase n=1 Tax=Agromyces sp. Marseille-P2726 TaxID=2709132 RepID=UPI001C2DAD47|nr:flavin reductase [Agromyces sp. Marseille-P2726]
MNPTTAMEVWQAADAENFACLFRAQPGGVTVITADDGSGPVALTATSVSSVSVVPPMLVLSASDRSSATPTIVAAETLVVHFLDVVDLELAKLAATSGVDRFADRRLWSRLPSGEPIYDSVARKVRVRTVDRVRAGGATVLIAQALDVHSAPSAASHPLVYHDRTWRDLGDSYVI